MVKKLESLPEFPKYPQYTREIEHEENRLLRIAKNKNIIPDKMDAFVHDFGSERYVEYYDKCREIDKQIKEMGYFVD